MISHALFLGLAAVGLVSGQTYSKCNPIKQDGCPADPAFGRQVATCTFSKDGCGVFAPVAGTSIAYGNSGGVFRIDQDGQAPTLETGKYIFYGRVDVQLQAAPGRGVVTSVVLQSDDLDEIDWEWIGVETRVQTNYFSKGDTSTYDRGMFFPVHNPTGSVHTYSIEWTKTQVVWSVDGVPLRRLLASNCRDGPSGFPQSPMQVKLGTWIAGRPGAPIGTVNWAGGYVDWSQKPFVAYYKSISITDYAGGDRPGKSATRYVYGDKSGKAWSIRVQ